MSGAYKIAHKMKTLCNNFVMYTELGAIVITDYKITAITITDYKITAITITAY